jgi:hypothetical protein
LTLQWRTPKPPIWIAPALWRFAVFAVSYQARICCSPQCAFRQFDMTRLKNEAETSRSFEDLFCLEQQHD